MSNEFCHFSFQLDLQNQLEHINKTIHESEKEVKRLENEQSEAQTSTTTEKPTQQPAQQLQQPTPIPAFLNGFTLEKMDNNEIRRLVIFAKNNFLFIKIEFLYYLG